MAEGSHLKVVDEKIFDPDIARGELITWARLVIATDAGDEVEMHVADRLLQLDDWLHKGGHLPQEWTEATHDGVSRGRSGL